MLGAKHPSAAGSARGSPVVNVSNLDLTGTNFGRFVSGNALWVRACLATLLVAVPFAVIPSDADASSRVVRTSAPYDSSYATGHCVRSSLCRMLNVSDSDTGRMSISGYLNGYSAQAHGAAFLHGSLVLAQEQDAVRVEFDVESFSEVNVPEPSKGAVYAYLGYSASHADCGCSWNFDDVPLEGSNECGCIEFLEDGRSTFSVALWKEDGAPLPPGKIEFTVELRLSAFSDYVSNSGPNTFDIRITLHEVVAKPDSIPRQGRLAPGQYRNNITFPLAPPLTIADTSAACPLLEDECENEVSADGETGEVLLHAVADQPVSGGWESMAYVQAFNGTWVPFAVDSASFQFRLHLRDLRVGTEGVLPDAAAFVDVLADAYSPAYDCETCLREVDVRLIEAGCGGCPLEDSATDEWVEFTLDIQDPRGPLPPGDYGFSLDLYAWAQAGHVDIGSFWLNHGRAYAHGDIVIESVTLVVDPAPVK